MISTTFLQGRRRHRRLQRLGGHEGAGALGRSADERPWRHAARAGPQPWGAEVPRRLCEGEGPRRRRQLRGSALPGPPGGSEVRRPPARQVFQWMVYNSTPKYDDMPPGVRSKWLRARWVVYSTRRNQALHQRGVEEEGLGRRVDEADLQAGPQYKHRTAWGGAGSV